MKPLSVSQLTLQLDPTVVDRWPTLRELIAHRVDIHPKLQKTIAADMGLAPGTLTKKLNPGEDYTNRFNCDDLEAYLGSTGDVDAVIEYLATKFRGGGDAERQARAVRTVEALVPEITRALAELTKARK